MPRSLPRLLAVSLISISLPAAAQIIPRAESRTPATIAPPAYAAVAELVVDSPLIVDVTMRRATRLRPAEAPDTPAGRTRFYVEADVGALILGAASLPPRISFVVELANGADGRPPRFVRDRELIFARPVTGQLDAVQLIRPGARLPWSPATDALVRRVAAEASRADAPPAITGVGSAVHSPGALPGEGQTQIFLVATGGRPVSLVIDRTQNAPPHWSVALSELVGQASPPPEHDTLLWYRLACGLPASLPASATADLDAGTAAGVAADYRVVLDALGSCDRNGAAVSGGAGPG